MRRWKSGRDRVSIGFRSGFDRVSIGFEVGRSYLEDVARQVLAVVDAAVHVDELVQRRLLLHRRVVQAADRERERPETNEIGYRVFLPSFFRRLWTLTTTWIHFRVASSSSSDRLMDASKEPAREVRLGHHCLTLPNLT